MPNSSETPNSAQDAPHPVDSFVGKRLWLRRKMLGLSQEMLANAVGLTFQQVQKYERGVNRISASRLHDFAKALQVPISYFFEGLEGADGDFTPTEGSALMAAEPKAFMDMQDISRPETIEMLKLYNGLSPNLRKRVNDMIRALASDSAMM